MTEEADLGVLELATQQTGLDEGNDRYHGYRQSLVVPRLFLHAGTLGFVHPVTGEAHAYESPLPDDLVGVLAGLGNR